MYLNLTEGWDPYNTNLNERVRHSVSTFPGGEPNVHVDIPEGCYVDISMRLTSFNDLGVLMMIMDALRRRNAFVMSIYIPYMPGARQDRIMKPGEALSVKVYADILNSFDTEIIIADPHSDVAVALLDNVKVINNHKFVLDCIDDSGHKEFDWDVIDRGDNNKSWNLISPDAGSNKKIGKLAMAIANDTDADFNVVKCDKTRNTKTGELSGFEVYTDDLEGKDCIIVDDICSNGGTFIGLADELKKKNAGDLYLIVTHGEFGHDRAKTMLRLNSKFKHVYYSDSFAKVFPDDDESTQIPIKL